jgi:hypothetical protein
MSEFIRTDQEYGNGVKLAEYKGKYYLHACREGKDGNVYDDWAYPQGPNRKPKDKAVPVKINLGDRETAKKTLIMILNNEFGVSVDVSDRDIPF